MSYYELFRGNYESAAQQIKERRQIVIDKTRKLQPDNLDELLAVNRDSEIDYDLDWVDVPNPWRPNQGGTITVKPILSCAEGDPDAEREKDRSDKGVWRLGIEARLPSGDTRYIGEIMFFSRQGQLISEPMIRIMMGPENDSSGTYTTWGSADAELFLTLAESTLAAQSD